jgi:hypothetical protein
MVHAILEDWKTQTRRIAKGEICPYGQPGDRLWVRESFQPVLQNGFAPNETDYKTGQGIHINYVATNGALELHDEEEGFTTRVTPSIHMPRWASRLTLEIVNVRCEQLQDISEADARAEGVASIAAYIKLWNKLNAKRGLGWDVNPWVWVIEFKRVEGKEGA